jgi:hypothetical protein
MKKLLIIVLTVCVVLALSVPVFVFAQNQSAGVFKVEVSFVYTRQSGSGSNQFAVWIEDAQGRYVKTLYATRFTAAGGWQRRPLSLPQWVKQSKLAEMNKTQIDALTGPTPQSGSLRYVWDGTDSAGRTVSAGEYRVFVEATFRNENCAVYTATVKLGEKGQSTAQVQYLGSGTAERGMIGPVTVTY